MRSQIKIISVIFLIFIFTGCALKSKPATNLIDQNLVKTGELSPGTARVHFYAGWVDLYGRKNWFKNTQYEFFIEGQSVGDIYQPNEFIAVDLYPGTYSFKWLPIDDNGQWYSEKLTITVKESDLIFLEANAVLESQMGALGGGLLSALGNKFKTSLERKYGNGQERVANKKLVGLNTTVKGNITPVSGGIIAPK